MILTCLCIFGLISPAISWGSIGHALVARLGQSQLTSSANSWVKQYLPSASSGDLGTIASWPDSILYPNSNPLGYREWQWSRELHYINIPDWNCSYIPSRDCKNDRCIEGALKNYSHRLIDNQCDYIDQQEALFFLVHFLGDVHQPLHSGFRNDIGGNIVKGYFLNGTNQTNLHSIWDEQIINYRLQRYFQSDVQLYFNYLSTLMLSQSILINETATDYQRWINESIFYVCNEVYFDDNHEKMNVSKNFTLGEEYFSRTWPIVDQRLARAGLRLSILLNQLSTHRSKRKLSPDMEALIIALCTGITIGLVLGILLYFLGRRYPRTEEMRPLLSEDA